MFCFFSHFFKISVLLHVFLVLIDLNNTIIICGTSSSCVLLPWLTFFYPDKKNKTKQNQKNLKLGF